MSQADRRLKVAFLSSPGHRDYVLAFGRILSDRCDLLLCIEDTVSAADVDAVGAQSSLRLTWPRHRDVMGNLRHLAALKKAIDAFDPDVVHVVAEGQVWFNLLKLVLGGRPLVVTLHDVKPHPGDQDTQKVPRVLVNAFVRSADVVIVHGQGLKADAEAVLGLAAARVFPSIHPISWRYRRIAEREMFVRPTDPTLRILFFGRIFKYKGLEHLVAAEARLGPETPPFKLVIAGRGDCAVAEAAAALRPERYDLRPYRIEDVETAQIFHDADVLALPYIEASQSGVLAIAPSFGLPVIASDIGEIGDVVRATGMGLLTPPGDDAALAEALRLILSDADTRARLAGLSKAAVEDRLSNDRIWDLTLKAYAAAMKVRRRG